MATGGKEKKASWQARQEDKAGRLHTPIAAHDEKRNELMTTHAA